MNTNNGSYADGYADAIENTRDRVNKLESDKTALLEALMEILYPDGNGSFLIGQTGDTYVSEKVQTAIENATK